MITRLLGQEVGGLGFVGQAYLIRCAVNERPE